MSNDYEAPELQDMGDAGEITLGGSTWIPWYDLCTFQYGDGELQ